MQEDNPRRNAAPRDKMTLMEEFKSRNFSKSRWARNLEEKRGLIFSTQVYTANGTSIDENGRSRSERWTDRCRRTGVLCIILCFALGIANIFHFDLVIIFSVIAM